LIWVPLLLKDYKLRTQGPQQAFAFRLSIIEILSIGGWLKWSRTQLATIMQILSFTHFTADALEAASALTLFCPSHIYEIFLARKVPQSLSLESTA